jgi:hypothetical protein
MTLLGGDGAADVVAQTDRSDGLYADTPAELWARTRTQSVSPAVSPDQT